MVVEAGSVSASASDLTNPGCCSIRPFIIIISIIIIIMDHQYLHPELLRGLEQSAQRVLRTGVNILQIKIIKIWLNDYCRGISWRNHKYTTIILVKDQIEQKIAENVQSLPVSV